MYDLFIHIKPKKFDRFILEKIDTVNMLTIYAYTMSTKSVHKKIDDNYSTSTFADVHVIINENGYINASKFASIHGKKIGEYMRLPRFIKMSKIIEKIECVPITKQTFLVNKGVTRNLMGRYVHPSLMLDIANWISKKFVMMMTTIINEYNIRMAIIERTHILEKKNLLVKLKRDLEKNMKLNNVLKYLSSLHNDEPIVENNEYILGRYFHAKINGTAVIINGKNSYINATHLEEQYVDKHYATWALTTIGCEIINILAKRYNIDICNLTSLVINAKKKVINGTYIHYALFLPFVDWLKNGIVEDDSKHNYIYIIKHPGMSFVKVGYWRSTLKRLRSRYRTPYGSNFTMFHVKLCGNIREHEKEFANKFKKYNMDSELYDVNYYDKYKEYLLSLVSEESNEEENEESNEEENEKNEENEE